MIDNSKHLGAIAYSMFFLFLGWANSHFDDGRFDLWSTDLRVLLVILLGFGTLWIIFIARRENLYMSKFLLALAALTLYLTVSTVTGIVRHLGDIEMPCVEWTHSECKECVETDWNDQGSEVCVASEWTPCEICTARKSRVHEERN